MMKQNTVSLINLLIMILVPFSIHVCGNCCMNLGNPLKILMNYLPIGGMTCLSYRDSFPMVNALV